MEAIVAILGAIIGLFIFGKINGSRVDAQQRILKDKVDEIEKKNKSLLEDGNERIEADKRKQQEIKNEQDKKLTIDELTDFFNKPKGK